MPATIYGDQYAMYLFGRVARRRKKVIKDAKVGDSQKKKAGQTKSKEVWEYEIQWWFTGYQCAAHVHYISSDKVRQGIQKLKELRGKGISEDTWTKLCSVSPEDRVVINGLIEDFDAKIGDDLFGESTTPTINSQTLHDIEKKLEGLHFVDHTDSCIDEPDDLYTHDDAAGGDKTKIKPEARHIFEHSTTSSFFAYIPLAFWKNTVHQTNMYAEQNQCAGSKVTLDEMMKFLGILFFMEVVQKGEYANYWGPQPEDFIFDLNNSINLDNVMPLRRFKFIRQNLCFRANVTKEELQGDPVARIRPLINIIKLTCRRYVIPGRELSVDEATVACRSKYGRHMILYNPKKPTGKFHFKIYACCCATSWLLLNFKIHCAAKIEARLRGVNSEQEIQSMKEATQYCSEIRKHVYEVVAPFKSSRRVITTDNYYTSAQLLIGLRSFGLYGRGTIKNNSAHFPRCIRFDKKTDENTGDYRIAVCRKYGMTASSWVDRNIVNIVSTADSSGVTKIYRQVKGVKEAVPSPICVAAYNKNMQGVDRMDQLRNKYSLSKGHSFKKWHKKLAMACIDFARVNAFITRSLALQTPIDEDDVAMKDNSDERQNRGAHYRFVCELAKELMFAKWAEAKNESFIRYGDKIEERHLQMVNSPHTHKIISQPSPVHSPVQCIVHNSKQYFSKVALGSRAKRGCVVCRFEGRHPCEVTDYCVTHSVALCKKQYTPPKTSMPFVCSNTMWTCWKKYHEYYLPRGVFNIKGNICKGSDLNLSRNLYLKKQKELTENQDKENQPTSNKKETTLSNISKRRMSLLSVFNSAEEGGSNKQNENEEYFNLLDISTISNASTEY
jgi:hypothetical protein